MAESKHGTGRTSAPVPCMLMRGGTSKGAYFLAEDLPSDSAARNELLLRIMGSPDPRQIDGLGGAHPLTSKVAVVSRSSAPDADLDYLFLQVSVDEPTVGTQQTCGNLLAGVGPFAVERGLIPAGESTTTARIRLVNTGDRAVATFSTPQGQVDYDGDVTLDGVPGRAGGITLEVGPGPGQALLPTGRTVDVLEGHEATLVANGMPVVLLRAGDLGLTGEEPPADLEARTELRQTLERIRTAAGLLMGLGDVTDQSVPKMALLSAPRNGGTVHTRVFIPHRVHTSIGVLMAASVSAGLRLPGAVGAEAAQLPDDGPDLIEHPTGSFPSRVSVHQDDAGTFHATSTSLRTARPVFDGRVFPRPRL